MHILLEISWISWLNYHCTRLDIILKKWVQIYVIKFRSITTTVWTYEAKKSNKYWRCIKLFIVTCGIVWRRVARASVTVAPHATCTCRTLRACSVRACMFRTCACGARHPACRVNRDWARERQNGNNRLNYERVAKNDMTTTYFN